MSLATVSHPAGTLALSNLLVLAIREMSTANEASRGVRPPRRTYGSPWCFSGKLEPQLTYRGLFQGEPCVNHPTYLAQHGLIKGCPCVDKTKTTGLRTPLLPALSCSRFESYFVFLVEATEA